MQNYHSSMEYVGCLFADFRLTNTQIFLHTYRKCFFLSDIYYKKYFQKNIRQLTTKMPWQMNKLL